MSLAWHWQQHCHCPCYLLHQPTWAAELRPDCLQAGQQESAVASHLVQLEFAVASHLLQPAHQASVVVAHPKNHLGSAAAEHPLGHRASVAVGLPSSHWASAVAAHPWGRWVSVVAAHPWSRWASAGAQRLLDQAACLEDVGSSAQEGSAPKIGRLCHLGQRQHGPLLVVEHQKAAKFAVEQR